MTNNLEDYVFAFIRDLHGLGVGDFADLNLNEFVLRVKQIRKGFSAEHEFAAIASWLGNCSLLSQIDGVLHSSAKYRAPDFLVVANRDGREIPFLVEVKSKEEDNLQWTEKYIESLRAFAGLMNLPLLVAWKRGKLWALTDTQLFTKKVKAFHLPFEEAMKNNLMSMLFGNEWITFAEGFRLELKLKILDDIDPTATLLPEGRYRLRIKEANLWGKKGKLASEDGAILWWFLVAAVSETRFDRVQDVATHKFIADSESMFNLSDVLVARLLWDKSTVDDIDWLAEIRKGLPTLATEWQEVLTRALEVGAVQYIFQQVPQVIPEFIEGTR